MVLWGPLLSLLGGHMAAQRTVGAVQAVLGEWLPAEHPCLDQGFLSHHIAHTRTLLSRARTAAHDQPTSLEALRAEVLPAARPWLEYIGIDGSGTWWYHVAELRAEPLTRLFTAILAGTRSRHRYGQVLESTDQVTELMREAAAGDGDEHALHAALGDLGTEDDDASSGGTEAAADPYLVPPTPRLSTRGPAAEAGGGGEPDATGARTPGRTPSPRLERFWALVGGWADSAAAMLDDLAAARETVVTSWVAMLISGVVAPRGGPFVSSLVAVFVTTWRWAAHQTAFAVARVMALSAVLAASGWYVGWGLLVLAGVLGVLAVLAAVWFPAPRPIATDFGAPLRVAGRSAARRVVQGVLQMEGRTSWPTAAAGMTPSAPPAPRPTQTGSGGWPPLPPPRQPPPGLAAQRPAVTGPPPGPALRKARGPSSRERGPAGLQ